MCDLSADGPDEEFFNGDRRARKDHVCFACDEPIKKGHEYHQITGIWWGKFQVIRHCWRCWEMVCAIQNYLDLDTVDLALDCGETWESATGEPPPDELGALAFLLPGERT